MKSFLKPKEKLILIIITEKIIIPFVKFHCFTGQEYCKLATTNTHCSTIDTRLIYNISLKQLRYIVFFLSNLQCTVTV